VNGPVLRVRPSEPHDEAAILTVVRDAFGADARDPAEEVRIVRDTWSRRTGHRRLELVADEAGALVGHVLAATGEVDGHEVPGIAPLGVVTHRQRDGIGSALMAHLLDEASARGWSLLLLLGDPVYYGRFGFVPASNLGIHYGPVGVGSPHFLAHCSRATTAAVPQGEFRYCWEL
jgi:predicted N-acetyltransferase YhbS